MNSFFRSCLLFLLIFVVSSLQAQPDSVRMFVFGHSLIDHRPPAIPTPSDETSILHWMYLLAQESGKGFAAGGQYGFLPQHDNLPPFSQWGYDLVPGVWESDTEAFSAANINTVLLTAGNFIQYQPAHLPHPVDESTTVLTSTESIFDWTAQQENGIRYYIYSNWPEMDLQSSYPPTLPTQMEVDAYHTQTIGPFTDWWVSYQDSLLASRPQYAVRLIPVGQIISRMLRDQLSYQVPFEEVYEDSDPHGRANLYFLAAMISYMAIFEEKIPASYTPDPIIHPIIRDSLSSLVDFIWEELLSFTDAAGNSRVFSSEMTTPRAKPTLLNLELLPNPTYGQLKLLGESKNLQLRIRDSKGSLLKQVNSYMPGELLDFSHLADGLYFLQIMDKDTESFMMKRFLKLPKP